MLLILSFSSQLVLADVYKCVSSTGKVSYSEERCKEGKIQKNGEWEDVGQREMELMESHKKLLDRVKVAETKGMSANQVKLLNSVLKTKYEDFDSLGYTSGEWMQVLSLLKLREDSLKAVATEISLRYTAGELNSYEAHQFNLFKAKEIDVRFDKSLSEKKLIEPYVIRVQEEFMKEARLEQMRLLEVRAEENRAEEEVRAEKRRAANVGDKGKVSHADAVWIGKKAVKRLLKDSDSAEFRGIEYMRFKSGGYICGEVNSKNSFGGFSGWQHFISAGTQSAYLEEQVADFRGIWRDYCRGKAW